MSESIEKMLYASIIAYVIVMIIIIGIKPKFLYNDDKTDFKGFGFDKNKTIFAVPIISLSLCVLIYFALMVYVVLVKKLKTK